MGSERGKYEMEIDHALMREMAYRKHLELMRLIKSTESQQVSAPPNNQTSKPTSEKRPSQIPNPENGPKTMMSPISLPPRCPSIVPRPVLSFQTGPKSVPRPFYSFQTGPKSVPRPSFSSQAGISSAPRPILSSQPGPRLKSVAGPRTFMPQSPRPSLPWQKTSHVGPNTGPRPTLLPSPPIGRRFEPTLGSSNKRKEAPTPTQQLQANHNNDGKVRKLFCEVCKVQCTSFPNLQMHFMGQKHKAAQVKKGKGVGQKSAEIETRKYCNLCDTWCMNEFSMKQHVSGKSHTLKLHTAQKKN